MPETLEELGLIQIELTVQIILEPAKLDSLVFVAKPGEESLKLNIEKAIAGAMGLDPTKGDRFKVNAYGWDFSPGSADKEKSQVFNPA